MHIIHIQCSHILAALRADPILHWLTLEANLREHSVSCNEKPHSYIETHTGTNTCICTCMYINVYLQCCRLRGQVDEHEGLAITAKRVLQEVGQLRVTIWNVLLLKYTCIIIVISLAAHTQGLTPCRFAIQGQKNALSHIT